MSVTGRVILDDQAAEPSQAIVYFVPNNPRKIHSATPLSEPFNIVTENKELRPTVGVVTRGSTLRFPNRDPILHNLFSVSGDNRFDVGLYGPGEAPTTTLNAPGVVDIFCNVHHRMHAHVLVLDSPHYTRASASGRFELTGLPGTPGRLHVWHRQTEGWSDTIIPPANDPVTIALEVTRPALPPHRDKRGESYLRRDRDPYR